MAASYEDSPPDEGYSEYPLTLVTSGNLPRWLSNMSAAQKTEYVMSIIAHLPTAEVAEIVRRLRPRLYINFINHLPPEVCLKILGFLDPVSLINTARASREWMLLSMDRKLWQHLYLMEGFRVIESEIREFESSLNLDRSRPSEDSADEHASKRRATPQRILPTLQTDGDSEMTDVEMFGVKQDSIFGGRLSKEPRPMASDIDTPMLSPPATSPSRSPQRTRHSKGSLPSNASGSGSIDSTLFSSAPFTQTSSLVVVDPSDKTKKLNWQYLYSQRRRLEANWEAEKYTNFQLPHPQHPDEAHNECIYTIQHCGKYLVSGSRDRTLRIWDLNTQRLVRAPLQGHIGSVLCLQFDADPNEDLIVSGSSDATIILWKFSTGEIIQRIRKAHRESVLNVRFDSRVLVTCSKDKTIKVFNRRALNSGDIGYPNSAQEVNPVPTYLNNYGFNTAPSAGLPTLPPYSIIACLIGHAAAVNAVQIWGNEIVSVSGDRTVKLWNWPDQICMRSYVGHNKGIACVQYDGRRIVSGSSDNEVKVFDKESGLEVASLRAHTHLVRTVQAGFGDLPYSVEEDKEHAKAIDHEYFRAVDTGAVSRATLATRGRPRNAGSSKPEDITAYGAKLPPGGGGGKYGRIVSGSYDETIIIWRRDKEGVWKAQTKLRQEDAAYAAARATVRESPESNEIIRAHLPQETPLPTIYPPRPAEFQVPSQSNGPDAPTTPFAPGSEAYYDYLIEMTIPNGPGALRELLVAHPQLRTSRYLQHALSRLPANTRETMSAVLSAVLANQPDDTIPTPPANFSVAQASESSAILGHSGVSGAATTTAAVAANQQSVAAAAAAPVAAPPPAAHAPHQNIPANMLRVFKLQFDARRIICCSQTSTIVGWDFANGDEQIIEASRFFAPIE